MAVRAGGMVFHVNGASAELTPGMGIMVNSGRLHSCTPLEGFDDCLMVTGLFHPSLLDSKPVRDRGCVDGLIQNDAIPFLVLNGDAAPWQQEALSVGFGGASYYAESFRAWLGMSPSAYRRENRRQGGAGA